MYIWACNVTPVLVQVLVVDIQTNGQNMQTDVDNVAYLEKQTPRIVSKKEVMDEQGLVWLKAGWQWSSSLYAIPAQVSSVADV